MDRVIPYIKRFARFVLIVAPIYYAVDNGLVSLRQVAGKSMEPILKEGEYVIVSRIFPTLVPPQQGDIVVLADPRRHTGEILKRVVGTQGKLVASENGIFRVPKGQCYVEGDNKSHSVDSRSYGPLPLGMVRGRLIGVAWPPWNMRIIRGGHPKRNNIDDY